MLKVNFNSTNLEIAKALGASFNSKGKISDLGEVLSSKKPICFYVDDEVTEGGMVAAGFIQYLTDVPSRGSNSEANERFIAANSLASIFGTETFENSFPLYRSRELVNKATAAVLTKKIGEPLDGVSLIVTDSFEKSYDKQQPAKYAPFDGMEGQEKTSGGTVFYTNVNLLPIGYKNHSVLTQDKKGETSVLGVIKSASKLN
jgi:hypothetical protein